MSNLEFEIVPLGSVRGVFATRFDTFPEAMDAARALSSKENISVRVCRCLGTMTPEIRWVSNGVSGFEIDTRERLTNDIA